MLSTVLYEPCNFSTSSCKCTDRSDPLTHDPLTDEFQFQLECGPMPNVMVALPNIGGALCSMPQSLADAHYLTAVQ